MTTTPAVKEPAQAFQDEEIDLLKSTIMPGATDSELALFGKVCAQTGLSPFARQIFPVSREVYDKDQKKKVKKWSFQTSVDGFRLVAQRSGEYEGQTPTQWCGKDGAWKDVWLSPDFPYAARVGVYRKNFREPLYAIAVWDSYVQTFDRDGKQDVATMWKKMPELMLAKCAECLALRKAFPQELSGVYSQEEMAQSEESKTPEKPEAEEPKKIAAPKAAGTPSSIKPKTEAPKLPVAGKRLDPDRFITVGKHQGIEIESMSFENLEAWAEDAKVYLEKSKNDPETSFMDMARTYRAMKKRMAEIQPSMFDKETGTHLGSENDVP